MIQTQIQIQTQILILILILFFYSSHTFLAVFTTNSIFRH